MHCFPFFPSKARAQHLKTYQLETDTLKWLSATAEQSLGKRGGCLKPGYIDRGQNSNNKPKSLKNFWRMGQKGDFENLIFSLEYLVIWDGRECTTFSFLEL